MADHSGHRKRVKQEFLDSGILGWPEHRVLELLLFYALPQGDVDKLSRRLLEQFGSLAGVLDALPEELCNVEGVREHTAILLKLIPALSGRYLQSRSEVRAIVHTLQDACELLAPVFYGATNEMSYILCLDGKNQVQGVRKVSEGCINSAEINIRRIAEVTLSMRAVKIYLAHNHISNLALPSRADIETTMVIQSALAGVGIELVDHLVFVDGDMVSIRESSRSYEFV